MNAILRKYYNKWYKFNLKNKGTQMSKQTENFYNDILSNLKDLCRTKNAKLLDVACGIGSFQEMAEKKGYETYGIDISDDAVQIALKSKGLNVVRGESEKLPFKNDSFDIVTCLGSLEHFSDLSSSLKEMRRVLKPKGVCFLHVPNLMFLGHIYMTARYGIMPSEGEQNFSEVLYTYKGWKDLIEKEGFRIVRKKPYNDMHAARRVSKLLVFLWQIIFINIIPFNLSYCFSLYCRKKK